MCTALFVGEEVERTAGQLPSVRMTLASDLDTLAAGVDRIDPDCILIDGVSPLSRRQLLWETLDACVRAKPVQLLAICLSPEARWEGFVQRVDDMVYHREELPCRVELAMHRLRRMRALWCETQFYRWAAREEERVSSQIVNETFGLREAYRNAEQINIELAQSHRELERVSRLDGLSGLLNRSSLFATVDAELERTERTGNALCAVMMDIDRFKNINDTFGHACGDAVLRGVGGLLQRELRKYDQAGRYGGEEFLIVLPNTTVIAATAFAERVRRALHLLPIEHGGTTLRVSASFGVARYRVGEGRDRWISRADRALYRAKRSGRNRVEGESDDS